MPTTIKATHKSIASYYATLKELAAQNVSHEMATRRAFQTLLAETAKLHDWTLITEESFTPNVAQPPSAVSRSGTIRPDATLRDKNTLPRGFWEAKDTGDSLEKEIAKKKAKGYSLMNTIFEDTQTAILYQNGKHTFQAILTDPQQLADLLNQFYSHTEPDIENFETAVNDFKDRVPDLATGLKEIIATAHKKNPRFKKAFTDFFTLCQTALNPNIAESAVDEMLIQHILTERLFRTIFNAADFTQRNIIAAEVEKVIKALAVQSFSRDEYLKGLDRFYLAIENASKLLDWTEKQHFLNIVYERFFQGYSTKTADTMGIVYTPQPIVDFMCASVAEVLKKEFNKELGDSDVFVLDPCTGTGNFVVNLLRRIPPKKLPRAYVNSLFANEIMLLPYYIAALNIEHAYYELTGKYEPFEGLCFVDTLDIAEHHQNGFDFFTQQNSERVERQKQAPITVVVGNPPYNMGQQDENDNNQNRVYAKVDSRIRETFAADSTATLKNKLYDAYVKFIRWAIDRLGVRDGIICFVSNNSFVDQIAFDGMRMHLAKEFTSVYHLDLQGNVRHNPTLSGTRYNVFGIQVGVGITIAVRKGSRRGAAIKYFAVPLEWQREEKLAWLGKISSASKISWQTLLPDKKNTWLIPENSNEFDTFASLASKDGKSGNLAAEATIFELFSLGIVTSRDEWVYDFSADSLSEKIRKLILNYNSEMHRLAAEDGIPKDLAKWIKSDQSFLKWTDRLKEALAAGERLKLDQNKVRRSLYRPFTMRHLYFDHLLNQRRYQQHYIFPTLKSEAENAAITLTTLGSEKPFMSLVTKCLCDLHLVGAGAGAQCFPFYTYDADSSNRRENITDWSLAQFRTHYKDKKISKWDIFYYVYGILHHPAYRAKFADNLKRELPRIPFAPSTSIIPGRKYGKLPSALADGFWAFSKAGKKLADLHLNYESTQEFPLTEIITPGTPRSPRVESKMKLTKDKTAVIVNDSLTLAGIPPETFNYKLGNRSALDWIIDQYQVYTDKRTNITSDPNAWGEEHNNPEYIIQLIAKIITVSLETQKTVENLPAAFAPGES